MKERGTHVFQHPVIEYRRFTYPTYAAMTHACMYVCELRPL